MSLVTCPECGKEGVSDQASACPQCGFNLKEHFSKPKEYHVKYCSRCAVEKPKQPYHTRFYIPGYVNYINSDESKYCKHGSEQIPYRYLNITNKEFHALCVIKSSAEYIEEMNQLKLDDPERYKQIIAYGIKKEEDEQANAPKCPTCGSTNIEKISMGKKVFGGAMFGLFSSDVRKTMHCKSCGYKW